MYGAILVNQKYSNATQKVENKISRLLEEFKKENIQIDILLNDASFLRIDEGKTIISLKKYDFIVYLDKDRYCARMLEKAGYKLFNNSEFIEMCDDKMFTHIALSDLGISMPLTVPGPLCFDNKPSKDDEEVIKNVIREIPFPIILKRVYGSLGERVYLANNKDELLALYRENKSNGLLFQQYICSNNSSLRILVIDRKIVATIKRLNETSFKSNEPNGHSYSEEVVIPQKLKDEVQKIIDAFDIKYAGIDYVIDENNNFYFLEMNSNAFFEEVEKTTKFNVANAFVQMIIKECSKD